MLGTGLSTVEFSLGKAQVERSPGTDSLIGDALLLLLLADVPTKAWYRYPYRTTSSALIY
jgi:hypothetical protein